MDSFVILSYPKPVAFSVIKSHKWAIVCYNGRKEVSDVSTIRMTFRATEEYHARLKKIKKSEDLRKCRCWFDCMDDNVTVTLDNSGIALEYKKKTLHAPWAELINVTEVRDGLLLRLNKGRVLLLPAGADDEALISAGILLGRQCTATFRSGRTRLRGVSPGRWLDYHTRRGQWFDLEMHGMRWIVVLALCFGIAIGTLMTWSPFTWNRLIKQEDAVVQTAVFESFEAEYRYHRGQDRLQEIHIQFAELGIREVDDNCPLSIVKENLSLAAPGDTMTLLTHPETGEVLAMASENRIFVSYEDYVKYHRRHNGINIVFGLVWYAAAGGLIWELKKEKRK